jgi:hypothetical protein
MVTDETYRPIGKIVPGQSATTEPVKERVAAIQPIKIGDSKTRGKYAASASITGTAKLPLMLSLHGSQSRGGAASDHGDLYLYFGTPQMGWRDGLPGIFSVAESRGKDPQLTLFLRDAIENPRGDGPIETCWFGYFCVPVGAAHHEPRAYPFTENRLAWALDWVVRKYQVDRQRICSGGLSMGGMGSTQFSFRHPQLFAAVYPRIGRVRQTWLPTVGPGLPGGIFKGRWEKPVPMADGTTDYFERMDSVKWVQAHHEDLPFYGWGFGRQDTVESWEAQLEMVQALTSGHHGFAFAWSDEGHATSGGTGILEILKYYPPQRFARNKSYPAFGNSSINDNMGTGDRNQAALAGGVNLGFRWEELNDTPDRWSVNLANDLAKDEMTVDVTPRRCQQFKPKPGDKFKWTNSAGGSGEATADSHGLVTVERVRIKPGEATLLRISLP